MDYCTYFIRFLEALEKSAAICRFVHDGLTCRSLENAVSFVLHAGQDLHYTSITCPCQLICRFVSTPISLVLVRGIAFFFHVCVNRGRGSSPTRVDQPCQLRDTAAMAPSFVE